MIGYWPGVTQGKTLCSQPVIIEDFFPTILEMAGVKNPKQIGGVIDGQSFVSLLRGRRDAAREQRPLFWHFPNNWGPRGPGIGASSSIRLGDWKLIRYHEDDRMELFNLVDDLGEQHNRSESHSAICDRLAGRLSAYLSSVHAQFPVRRSE